MSMWQDLLSTMVAQKASDLYLLAGYAPSYRVHGALVQVQAGLLTSHDLEGFADILMTPQQKEVFQRDKDMNTSYLIENVGRFRCNIYRQKSEIAIVVRCLANSIPTMDILGLPACVKQLPLLKSGLILVTGPTGSGKSTTIASMIQYRNQNEPGHIVTIEDPIEYDFPKGKGLISQRELGVDALSYAAAMKGALRQAPDVLMVGELRERDSVEMAINFSETGHLVIATLHSTNAAQAMQRLLQFFTEEESEMVCLRLSMNLKAVLSQKLLPRKDKQGRVLALEIMAVTPRIADLIRSQDLAGVKKAMQDSQEESVQTMDAYLLKLYRDKIIESDTALSYADSSNNLRLKMKGLQGGGITIG